MDSFVDVYKESLSQIPIQLKKRNINGCCYISSDLTRFSVAFKSKEHVFISEFLEYLFTNLKETSTNYDLSEETFDEITFEIAGFIDELTSFVVKICAAENQDVEKDKIKIYDRMRDIRYLVTSIQLMNRMTRSPSRKPRLMFD